MKTAVWIGLGVTCMLGLLVEPSVAKDDPCRIRVGHARPAGCAPFSPKAVKRTPKRIEKKLAPGPVDPELERAMRPRQESSKRRSERLLILELARTERLLARTPKGAPDRARIIRRLAEGYAELERLAQLRRLKAELRQAIEADRSSQH